MTPFDQSPPGDTAGISPATDGPETTNVGLVGANYDLQAIDENMWFMRQGRIGEKTNAMLNQISQELNGDPTLWEGQRPELELPAGGMFTVQDYAEFAKENRSTQAEATQRMFDNLERARILQPGRLANFPGSLEDVRKRAEEETRAELLAERNDALHRDENRSVKTAVGGVSAFAGAAGAAVADVESVALLPFAAVGASANLARTVLVEGVLGAAAEAVSIPAYNAQADFLGTERPDVATQLAFGAAFGAALPVVGRGVRVTANAATKKGRIRNRDLLKIGKLRGATDLQRGAANVLARDIASEEIRKPGQSIESHDEQLAAAEKIVHDQPDAKVRPQDLVPRKSIAGQPGVIRQTLDFIRDHEAGGNYDTVYSGSVLSPPRPITQMTINDVLAWQDASVRAGSKSSAAGGYQIIRKTMRGLKRSMDLSGNEVFDAAMQDRMAIRLMREKGLEDFKTGKLSPEKFGNGLAAVWAALPLLTGENAGRSVYAGDGLNAAGATSNEFFRVLTEGGTYTPLGPNAQAANVYGFSPDTLRTDADAYQYKLDGNELGVNDRLQFEREWDPSAGVGVIVHERADGDRFIADGHQRLGLAQRLAEGGQAIELQGFLYRETDGFSVSDVRTLAALKNIRQESGTPLDAARVIRDHPELTDAIGRTRPFMAQAEGLARLHPGPYQAVINDVVPQHYASIVGRLIPDSEDIQATAVATLAKASPANVLQAESIVRDIRRLGIEREADKAQGSLFGDGFDLGQTVISERAKVIDATLKDLKKDKATFARLTKDGARIQEAGNVLNQSENLSRQQAAQQALERIIILADEDGPIRDAIDDAARSVRAGTSIADAAQTVIDAIGRENPGDGGRVVENSAGRNGDASPVDRVDQEPDEPVGPAIRDPDLFGDPVESRGALAQVETLEREIREALKQSDQADFEIRVGEGNAAETVKVSQILDDLAEEEDFLEQLKFCMPKGSKNG